AHDELVLRRAAGVHAGVDDERTALREPRLTAREGVLVQLRGRRVPEDMPANGDSVLGELVPIGNDRDHESPSYCRAAPTDAATVRRRPENGASGGLSAQRRSPCSPLSSSSPPRRPTTPTSRRSRSASRRSSASSRSRRTAATGSRTSRPTST